MTPNPAAPAVAAPDALIAPWRIEPVNPASLAPPAGHFDRAVRIGPWLFVSGTSALTNRTGPVAERRLPDDFRTQADEAFDNIERVLEEVGATFADVFEIRATLARASDFAELNALFRERIPGRGFVGSGYVAEFLGPGMLIEVEVKAYLPAFADPIPAPATQIGASA